MGRLTCVRFGVHMVPLHAITAFEEMGGGVIRLHLVGPLWRTRGEPPVWWFDVAGDLAIEVASRLSTIEPLSGSPAVSEPLELTAEDIGRSQHARN